ncbi:Gfo/Idh/MocA family protein [Terracoccus luteus]|nr:Gfo/Idh/MocA family oxidoreductase [Terracoccus luteus]MCP2173931.1 putative dehydrogenase [Terracoccus luteus]
MTGDRMPLRLGVVGAGGFADFVLGAAAGLDDLVVAAVVDRDPERARDLADRHGAAVADDVDALLRTVDVVLVATTPDSHAELATRAVRAGRHVLCEKPLATSAADALDVVAEAEQAGVVVTVDHVLRHNPLLAAVVRLRDEVLGPVRRFAYENDAADEGLGPDHWFWDTDASGGILLEHAVHALDAAHWLLGSRPTHAQATGVRRPTPHGDLDGLLDVVSVTTAHPGGALATHTHSFTHADRCERQWLRLDHGAAQTVVHGWIPVTAEVDLWTDDDGVATVQRLAADPAALFAVGHIDVAALPAAGIEVEVQRDAGAPGARARGADLSLPHRVHLTLDLGGEDAKQQVYAAAVRSAVADLLHCVRTGDRPVVDVTDAAAAVIVAAGATRALETGTTVSLLLPPPPQLAPPT